MYSYCVFFLFFIFLNPAISVASELINEATQFLSQDELKGRVSGTQENLIARNWIVEKLKKMNVEPAGDNGTYFNNFTSGSNIVGIVKSSGNFAPSEAPTVLIGAHYDHVKTCRSNKNAISKVCNGAADNAAAVAAVLGAIETLRLEIKTPIAVVFWDAEESGLLGSNAFVKRPSFDISKLKLYINLDIIGMNLFKGLESDSFVVGTETGGSELISDVREATSKNKIRFKLASYAFGHFRSDMTSFVVNDKKIPFAFFSDGDGAVYHSDADEVENLNMEKVRSISAAVKNLALIASSRKSTYRYIPPKIYLSQEGFFGRILKGPLRKFLGARNGIVFPEFDDANVIFELLNHAIDHQNENQLEKSLVNQLVKEKEAVAEIIRKGPQSFDFVKRFKLAQAGQLVLKTARELSIVP